MQLRTSAGTSINAKKLPALYTKLSKLGVLANGTGIGFETQNGKSWQRNQKLKQYAQYCSGYDVGFKNGVMIVQAQRSRKGR